MDSTKLRVLAGGLAVCLLTSAYSRLETSTTMAEAARTFLNSLEPTQRAQAVFKFDDDERLNWHFIPKPRKGVPLREMTSTAKATAHGLLAAGLSQRGYIKATQIMSLEDILRILEAEKPANRRDPEGYFFSIFGEPSEKGTWGYRVEGHHFATNFTIVNGKVTGSPNFYGTNPAEVRKGPRAGLRVLAAEEDLGRELLMSLSADQRKVALVQSEALKDMITLADRDAALKGKPGGGFSASKMNAKQKELLGRLVEEYANNMPEQLAQARMDMYKKAGDNILFAWTGVETKGGPHYYRVQAPSFLIEYDNTQNDSNHVHSVWRDYAGDFGRDLLGDHLKAAH